MTGNKAIGIFLLFVIGLVAGLIMLISHLAGSATGEPETVSGPVAETEEGAVIAESGDFSYETKDGFVIHGTRLVPESPKNISVMLLHMMANDRRTFDELARRLQAEGYETVSIDLRGHGQSDMQHGAKKSYKLLTREEFDNIESDVDRLMDFVSYDSAYAVGASIGANVAFRHAAVHDSFSKVVLLSPGKVYHGINMMTQTFNFADKPALAVAAAGDKYSYNTVKELETSISNCTVLTYGGSSHGTNLLDANRELYDEILEFLES